MTAAPDLEAVLAATWRVLADATTRRTPYTLAALATVDGTGGPQVRSVILRDCDPDGGTVAFATDARSTKVAEIGVGPRVALTVWDDDTGVQVRLSGGAVLADADERRRRWDALGPHTRRGYGSPSVPGTPLPPGDRPAEPDDEDAWFDRFAWVRVRVDRVDRLDISADPHDRAVFVRARTGWEGERVAP
jgi:hypothetical protein